MRPPGSFPLFFLSEAFLLFLLAGKVVKGCVPSGEDSSGHSTCNSFVPLDLWPDMRIFALTWDLGLTLYLPCCKVERRGPAAPCPPALPLPRPRCGCGSGQWT